MPEGRYSSIKPGASSQDATDDPDLEYRIGRLLEALNSAVETLRSFSLPALHEKGDGSAFLFF